MITKIFYEDLNEDMQSRIRMVVRYELEPEIDEAVENGLDRETAEDELIADYINRNNVGCAFKI